MYFFEKKSLHFCYNFRYRFPICCKIIRLSVINILSFQLGISKLFRNELIKPLQILEYWTKLKITRKNSSVEYYRRIFDRFFFTHTSIWKKVSIENPAIVPIMLQFFAAGLGFFSHFSKNPLKKLLFWEVVNYKK